MVAHLGGYAEEARRQAQEFQASLELEWLGDTAQRLRTHKGRRCSCKGPEFGSQHPRHPAHYCLYFG